MFMFIPLQNKWVTPLMCIYLYPSSPHVYRSIRFFTFYQGGQSNLPLRQCALLVGSRNWYASIPIITEKSLFSFENKETSIKICNPNFLSCFSLHFKIWLTPIIYSSLIKVGKFLLTYDLYGFWSFLLSSFWKNKLMNLAFITKGQFFFP